MPASAVVQNHEERISFLPTERLICVLTLKHDAVRVEVHHTEHSTSDYQGRPLTIMSRDDMLMEQIQ
jgi:hypothetical protein